MSREKQWTQFLKGRDFLTTNDFTKSELLEILDTADELKRKFHRDEPHALLQNKTLFMIFYNPSTRTRNSFEAGMTQLGGHAHYLRPGTMQIAHGEKVRDTAIVLSRYGNAIGIRAFGKATEWEYGRGQNMMENYAKWASVPVINFCSNVYHPCQILADLQTVREKKGLGKGVKVVMSWAYSPNPWRPPDVPNSVVSAFPKMGLDVTLACPEEFMLDPEIMKISKENAKRYGGSIDVTHNLEEAVDNADILYGKNFNSYEILTLEGKSTKEKEELITQAANKHKDWVITQDLLDSTGKTTYYMHCLPADVGVEITEKAYYGSDSIIFDEAENRLHAQKALLSLLV